ncbi:hypothetical protein CAPTEDRAFT_191790 [Capitella teleta]|uniref:Sushi domain-containing protein n=1 Tax=Capitella teleta TaxID=283909 RepID=R7TJR7_CAPTE|nr:hypothetical protein CAPTEDRAFT_191790 [Capitella teleta]|eukprot:ELT93954.1 hypothetical protein CAPTEDRAFT_191790 [Capitella teleta]
MERGGAAVQWYIILTMKPMFYAALFCSKFVSRADTCTPPSFIYNGYLKEYKSTYHSVVEVVCYEDYRLANGRSEALYECQENGEWQPIHDCKAGRCPKLPVVRNAKTTDSLAIPQAVGLYYCDEGYEMKGDVNYTTACVNGSWVPMPNPCHAVQCRSLHDLGHYSNISNDQVVYATEVTVTCPLGHWFDGNTTVTLFCNNSAQWNPAASPCERKLFLPKVISLMSWSLTGVDCGKPSGILNAATSYTRTDYESQVEYECLRGMWFSRGRYSATSTCNEFGQWAKLQAKCSELDKQPMAIPVTEADGSDVFGWVISGILLSIIAFIVISDIPMILRQVKDISTVRRPTKKKTRVAIKNDRQLNLTQLFS